MNQADWNAFVEQLAPRSGAFLQSYEWGEFQRSLGRQVERIEDDNWIAQAIRYPLPLGMSYWTIPKGPLGKVDDATIADLQSKLGDGVFLRVEPSHPLPGARRVKDVHPGATSIIDLTQSLEAIKAQMKSKTRYNIRVAEREGITVKFFGKEQVQYFVALMDETSARDGFSSHVPAYYAALLAELEGTACHAFLGIAYYRDKPLAANVMIDFAGVRTYLHGASSNEHRNLMAPYALHDALIEDAHQKGMKAYDFWGIAPPGSPDDHPWTGITRFKLGFGGEVVTTPGTFEIPLSTWQYGLYRGGKFLARARHLLKK